MGINQLTGTPWHVEQLRREEGDERRHNHRCIFYEEQRKCNKKKSSCIGSAHCMEYVAMSDAEFKRKQEAEKRKKQMKKNHEDDCYWY